MQLQLGEGTKGSLCLSGDSGNVFLQKFQQTTYFGNCPTTVFQFLNFSVITPRSGSTPEFRAFLAFSSASACAVASAASVVFLAVSPASDFPMVCALLAAAIGFAFGFRLLGVLPRLLFCINSCFGFRLLGGIPEKQQRQVQKQQKE